MFITLRAEMARVGMTCVSLAKVLGITNSTLSTKLNGRSQFTLDEALAVKRALGSKLSLEKLFARE